MVATVVNSITVILGTIIGLSFRNSSKKEIWESVLKAVGIVVFIFGIVGVFKAMVYIDGDGFKTRYDLLLLLCLAGGTFLGEIINIDQHLKNFGNKIEKKLNRGAFSEGFISASLIFCIGAMAIVGSMQAALGDPSTIYLKAIIDGITAIILASTLGFGVAFSAISILIYQGAITILGMVLGDFMSINFQNAFSIVGYAIVACIGLNFIYKEKIKVANMLPSLLIVILYFLFTSLT